MPSRAPLPTVEELRQAFLAEATVSATARGDQLDSHAGSLYDHAAGVGAILLSRVAARDRDEFRALYFTHADDRGLDLLATAVGRPRQQATRGQGTLSVERASAGASGWFRAGTRVSAGGAFSGPEMFRLTADAWAATSDVRLRLPIEAEHAGNPALRMNATDTGTLRWEDPISDAAWVVSGLVCEAGTAREGAATLREALRESRRAQRVGFSRAIADGCRDAGASFVALFASDYLGTGSDRGLNLVYVADSADITTDSLLRRCRAAMASIALGGSAIQVRPSQRTTLDVELEVALYDPSQASRHLRADVVASVVDYFRDAVLWRESGISGAVFRALRGMASAVTVKAPLAEPPQEMPSVLDRYDVPSHAVRVDFVRAS